MEVWVARAWIADYCPSVMVEVFETSCLCLSCVTYRTYGRWCIDKGVKGIDGIR